MECCDFTMMVCRLHSKCALTIEFFEMNPFILQNVLINSIIQSTNKSRREKTCLIKYVHCKRSAHSCRLIKALASA